MTDTIFQGYSGISTFTGMVRSTHDKIVILSNTIRSFRVKYPNKMTLIFYDIEKITVYGTGKKKYVWYRTGQCCGSGFGIRCFFPLDPDLG
jgi:hypothetical protein